MRTIYRVFHTSLFPHPPGRLVQQMADIYRASDPKAKEVTVLSLTLFFRKEGLLAAAIQTEQSEGEAIGDDYRLLGVASMSFGHRPDSPIPRIEQVYLDQNFRGQGIRLGLIRHLVQKVAPSHRSRIELILDQEFEKDESLLERLSTDFIWPKVKYLRIKAGSELVSGD